MDSAADSTGDKAGEARPACSLSSYGRRLPDLPRPSPPKGNTVADFRYGDLSALDFPTLAWKRAVGRGDPAPSSTPTIWRPSGVAGPAERLGQLPLARPRPTLRTGPDHHCQRLAAGARPLRPAASRSWRSHRHREPHAIWPPDNVPCRRRRAGSGGRGCEAEDGGLADARLAYVTPSHQFPLGQRVVGGPPTPASRLGSSAGAHIVEDDYDGEYRYDVAPLPALQALDGGERVVYVGTVSKTLSPTLRLGYLVAPLELAEAFATAKRLADRHTPSLEQDALTDLITSGAYERHIRNARRKNRDRRIALLQSLGSAFGENVTIGGADAGLHVVASLNSLPREREQELLDRAAEAGLGIYPVSTLYDPDVPEHRPDCVGLVLGYASLTDKEISQGVGRLARAVSAMHAGRWSAG